MEDVFKVEFLSTHERKSCTLVDVTLDEAISFAIIIFQKYSRLPGDTCYVILYLRSSLEGGTKFITKIMRKIILNRDMAMEIEFNDGKN